MSWIKTGLECFLRVTSVLNSSSVCTLSFYFQHQEEISSYWVNREWEESLQKTINQIVIKLRIIFLLLFQFIGFLYYIRQEKASYCILWIFPTTRSVRYLGLNEQRTWLILINIQPS